MFEPLKIHIADKPCILPRSVRRRISQRSPLHIAEIHPRRERKVRGWPDIPRLAVQTAGIGASFPADAHDIRHGRQEVRFRLFECSPTHKKWVTRVAQGAAGYTMGWL